MTTIEKNTYLTALENKVAYDKVFSAVEETFRYHKFFVENDIEVDGSRIRALVTWPKEGKKFKKDLSIYNTADDFKREINIAKFDLEPIFDEVFYEMVNEERFMDALDSAQTCKRLTDKLKENATNFINIKLEEKVPHLICNDENFVKYDESSKKGNLYEIEEDKFKDPLWIHEQIFNASSLLRKISADYNKGQYNDESKSYEPLTTNVGSFDKMFLLIDSHINNKRIIGGYKDNVNFVALDLEKRFGKGNIEEDILPNDYGMVLMDRRALQFYKKNMNKGFRNKEEAETGNQWFFLNPRVWGNFIPGFNAIAWKIKKTE